MLIEVDSKYYRHSFPQNPHPFISDGFVELNKNKCDRLVRLVEDSNKPGMGLVAGIKDAVIRSPFSAPFGGFHFKKEVMYYKDIEAYIEMLQGYIQANELKGIELTLPPDIYNMTFNAKSVNAIIRAGFKMSLPEITNWVNLDTFNGTFSQRNSREYYNQALRNDLVFELVDDLAEKELVYELIRQNRAKFGRPIYMSFEDIINTSKLWGTDFFKVTNQDNEFLASGIFYRSHPEIAYALFWGDNEKGRPLRAMDFLASHLWTYYKELDYKFIDLGISTESGVPNDGLLRFKESHEASSSIKYSLSWYIN